MLYTVYWEVNDGRYGYPNIVADLDWSDIDCKTYKQAIRMHAEQKGVRRIFSISETNRKGKIRERNYRDFYVSYIANDAPLEKELHIGDEVVSKIIRVFGSRARKTHASGVQELYPA